MKKNKTGFTLIELIIVLGIIGVILTLSIISLGGIRQNTRDMSRVSDVKQIQAALELYRANEGHYPTAVTPGQALSSGSSTYLNLVPSNPNPSNNDVCGSSNYAYVSTGYSYTLEFCLEKSSGSLIPGDHCATPAGIKDGTCSGFIISSIFGDLGNDELNETLINGNNIYAVGKADVYALITSQNKNLLNSSNIVNHYFGKGNGTNVFNSLNIESNASAIYAAGNTSEYGSGLSDGLVAKINPDLTLNAAATYGGSQDEYFYDSYYDSDKYLYVVGSTASEGSGSTDGIIAKYNNELSLEKAVTLGGPGIDDFRTIVASSDNKYFYVLGQQINPERPEGTNGFIAAYTENLDLKDQQFITYKDDGSSMYLNKAVIDGSYIYAVGAVKDKGDDKSDAAIVKIKIGSDQTSLSLEDYGVYYSGNGIDSFSDLAINNGQIYVTGNTTGEGEGLKESLLLQFDTNLNLIDKELYGGGSNDFYSSIGLDAGQIYTVGYTDKGFFRFKDTMTTKVKNLKNDTLYSVPTYFKYQESIIKKATVTISQSAANQQAKLGEATKKNITADFTAGSIDIKKYSPVNLVIY